MLAVKSFWELHNHTS